MLQNQTSQTANTVTASNNILKDTQSLAASEPIMGEEPTAVKSDGQAYPSNTSKPSIAQTNHRPHISWGMLLFAVWLTGALSVLAFHMIRHARFLRQISRWQSPVPPHVQMTLDEQSARLRVNSLPAYIVPFVQSPTIVGVLRPLLLLPPIDYSPKQLGLMIAHELVHFSQGHLWGKALVCLASAVHWFSPLMPRILRDINALCEMACDESVLAREESENQDIYVDAILSAAMRTKAIQTQLCSQWNGGMKQMEQRIERITPFRPRRVGIGLIASTLLLALLTGSVLATESISTAGFSITESDWLTLPTNNSWMQSSDYDFIMSFETPGWESLATEDYNQQIHPQLTKLITALDQNGRENRFIRQLEYSATEASHTTGDGFQVLRSAFSWRGGIDYVYCDFGLNWAYIEDARLMVGERNQLLDAACAHVDQALCVLEMPDKSENSSLSAVLTEQLDRIAKTLGGNLLRIWYTNVSVQTHKSYKSPLSPNQQALLNLVAPDGYREQTVTQSQSLLAEYQDRFRYEDWYNVFGIEAYHIVQENSIELSGSPYYSCMHRVDSSLMPAWPLRGDILFQYTLDWQVNDPDHITVGQRHDAIARLQCRIVDTATAAMWTAPDWAALDKSLKESLPTLGEEESTPEITLTVSGVGLEIMPLATDEYVYSTPRRALAAFMTSWYYIDTDRMEAVCTPIGSEADQDEAHTQRDALLKSYVATPPIMWSISANPELSEEENSATATVVVALYERPFVDAKDIVAHLQRIDGKWYLLPESLQE